MVTIRNFSSEDNGMFVFAMQLDPSVIVQAAKVDPVYLPAFVLAAMTVHLYWKDFAMREDNKLNRDDEKVQLISFLTSMDKIAEKV